MDKALIKKNSRKSKASRFARTFLIRLGFYFLLLDLSFIFLYPFITMIVKSLMTDDDLYFFIGDELKIVYTGLGSGPLVIGSENAACTFRDMTALTKTDDGADYEQALAEYAAYLSEYGSRPAAKIRV